MSAHRFLSARFTKSVRSPKSSGKSVRIFLFLALLLSMLGAAPAQPVKAIDYEWTAYNDGNWLSGQVDTNITKLNGWLAGSVTLVKRADGTSTGVTLAFSKSGSVDDQSTSTLWGAEPNSGTDGYTTFHDHVNMVGGVRLYSVGAWVDATFSGLDPNGRYTFASTANRGVPDNTDRWTKYTISGVDAATNASTTGVTVIDSSSVTFSTGDNTANGYVARWTGINPGSDGTFKVRYERYTGGSNTAYGPAVLMLAKEVSGPPSPTITTSVSALSAFSTTPGTPSAAQTYTVSGSNLTTNISITAPGGFELSTNGTTYSSSLNLTQSGGTVGATTIYARLTGAAAGSFSGNITHTSTGATPQNVAVTGTVAATPPTGGKIAFATDMHQSTATLTTVLTCMKNAGFTPDIVALSGDFNNVSTAGTAYNSAVVDPIIEAVFPGVVKSYVIGNNDSSTLMGTGNFPATSGKLYETSSYIIYGIHEYDFPLNSNSSNGGTQAQRDAAATATINKLQTFLTGLTPAQKGKAIFILSHVPLHVARTDNPYGYAMATMLNNVINADLDVVFLWGHNHTTGYQQFFYDKGTSVNFNDNGTSKSLTTEFAYGNAGFLNGSSTNSSVVDSGTAAAVSGSTITLTRYQRTNCNVIGTLTVTRYAPVQNYTLTAGNDGHGTVALNPAGGTYAAGTTVTLTPQPSSGYVFSSWTGPNASDIVNTAGVYTIVMNGNKSVTANFTAVTRTLGDVNSDGKVNSDDALIVLSAELKVGNTTPYCPMNCGDVDGDGAVTSTDALIILSHGVGMSVPYPVGTGACPVNITQPAGCS